jgi:intracellular multiplication protein IcmE
MKQYFANLKGTVAKSKGMLIFVGVSIALVLGWVYFRSPDAPVTPSLVSSSVMNDTTIHGGTQPISDDYRNQLHTADDRRAATALETGTSALPTVVGTTIENEQPLLVLKDDKAKTPEISEPVAEIMQQPIALNAPITETVPLVTAAPTAVAVPPERINAMVGALTRRTPPVAEVVAFGAVIPPVVTAEQSAPSVGDTNTQAAKSKIKLPLAGTILYAQLVGRANSDHPGPVLAKILQGDYEGATLIGSFQVSQSALIISFDRMTVAKTRDGEEINETIPIEAVAVDTTYIGSGLATSVDRHMFQKLAIAFTSGFAQGFGDAISNKGETTIDTSNGTITTGSKDLNTKEELFKASGQAVSQAGSILQQEFGNRPTTVIVEAGTPIGVLFLQK